LIQTLSAKLGIATGRNLPEVCRERFSRRTSRGLWVQAEIIAMATDLAEFLGAAIGFQLLFGIALFPATLITGATTFAILGLQRPRGRGPPPAGRRDRRFRGRVRALLHRGGVARPPAARHGREERGRAALQRRRVAAPGSRHPRRHGDAACDLPALRADA